ncbi:MAG: hypothetical protein WCJ30_23190, partial [Deltaproteobacteria bacterium]
GDGDGDGDGNGDGNGNGNGDGNGNGNGNGNGDGLDSPEGRYLAAMSSATPRTGAATTNTTSE